MLAKKFSLWFGVAALICTISPTVLADTMLDVTFNVPVKIQNIHSDWNKFAVYCMGYGRAGTESSYSPVPGDPLMQQVGMIDVSNKSRDAIVDVTVTGSVQVPSLATTWMCELRIQHKGETGFNPVLGRGGQSDEIKAAVNDRPSGKF